MALCQRLGYLTLGPRDYSPIGLLAPYDGNLLGGMLLGAGMALSGSCPGTVFAQLGAGIASGFYALAGGVLGGVVWSGVLGPALGVRARKTAAEKRDNTKARLAIHECLGASRSSAALGVAASFAAIVSVIGLLAPPQTRGLVTPVAGGLLIGAAQLVSIVARGKLLGTSTSFEEVGGYIWRAVGGRNNVPGPASYSTTVLTIGMIVGASLVPSVARLVSAGPAPQPLEGHQIQPARAFLGGVLLAVGSRMGGGCTSGHGISGVSLLSMSSFLSVAAMFGGGMAVAIIFGL